MTRKAVDSATRFDIWGPSRTPSCHTRCRRGPSVLGMLTFLDKESEEEYNRNWLENYSFLWSFYELQICVNFLQFLPFWLHARHINVSQDSKLLFKCPGMASNIKKTKENLGDALICIVAIVLVALPLLKLTKDIKCLWMHLFSC